MKLLSKAIQNTEPELEKYENGSHGQGVNFHQLPTTFSVHRGAHSIKLHQFLFSIFRDFEQMGRQTHRLTNRRCQKQHLLAACVQVTKKLLITISQNYWDKVVFRVHFYATRADNRVGLFYRSRGPTKPTCGVGEKIKRILQKHSQQFTHLQTSTRPQLWLTCHPNVSTNVFIRGRHTTVKITYLQHLTPPIRGIPSSYRVHIWYGKTETARQQSRKNCTMIN